MSQYEESLVAFVDFLGFSEASAQLDEASRLRVLDLLRGLVALRSDFSAAVSVQDDKSTRYYVTPAISTFSDNIVVSFSLETLRQAMRDAGPHVVAQDDGTMPFFLPHQLERLISTIAASALRLGFLVRGGV